MEHLFVSFGSPHNVIHHYFRHIKTHRQDPNWPTSYGRGGFKSPNSVSTRGDYERCLPRGENDKIAATLKSAKKDPTS